MEMTPRSQNFFLDSDISLINQRVDTNVFSIRRMDVVAGEISATKITCIPAFLELSFYPTCMKDLGFNRWQMRMTSMH